MLGVQRSPLCQVTHGAQNVPRARARRHLGLESFTQRVQRREGSRVSEEHCVRDDSGLAGTWGTQGHAGNAGSRVSAVSAAAQVSRGPALLSERAPRPPTFLAEGPPAAGSCSGHQTDPSYTFCKPQKNVSEMLTFKNNCWHLDGPASRSSEFHLKSVPRPGTQMAESPKLDRRPGVFIIALERSGVLL